MADRQLKATWRRMFASGSVCERWKDFDTWLSDVGPRPAGFILGRNDLKASFSPESAKWMSRAKMYSICETRVGKRKNQPERYDEDRKCRQCSKVFRFTELKSNYCAKGVFCSKECRNEDIRLNGKRKNRLLPERSEIVRLYRLGYSSTDLAKKFGLKQHKSVLTQLYLAGEPTRKRSSGAVKCCVEGCLKRPMKVRHAGNGSMYGRMCADHRQEHRKSLSTAGKLTENALHRLGRVASKFASTEVENENLHQLVAFKTQEIERLTKELRRIKPTDTKWGWMTWTLNRPEIDSLRVPAPEDVNERQRERRRLYSALYMLTRNPFAVKYVFDGGKNYFEIVKRGQWPSKTGESNE
jgi:hypothetical protein